MVNTSWCGPAALPRIGPIDAFLPRSGGFPALQPRRHLRVMRVSVLCCCCLSALKTYPVLPPRRHRPRCGCCRLLLFRYGCLLPSAVVPLRLKKNLLRGKKNFFRRGYIDLRMHEEGVLAAASSCFHRAATGVAVAATVCCCSAAAVCCRLLLFRFGRGIRMGTACGPARSSMVTTS